MDADRARETIATQRPRRLRLGELLYQLGARPPDPADRDDDGDDDDDDVVVAASPAASNGHATNGRSPDGATDGRATDGPSLEGRAPDGPSPAAPADASDASGASGADVAPMPRRRRERLSVGELVDRASEGGFGFLIGVLALIAIPFFGLSTPFGLAIALLGAQLLIGRSQPWLPARARRRELSMAMLDRVAGLLAKRTRWLARSTRPRWERLIMPRTIGAGVTLLALGLALPLPIPGSNLIFLVPLLVYAIGILERDGVWVALGHVCLLIDIGLLIAFGGAVWMVFERVARWIF